MADTAVQTDTIETAIPSRIDRLPWARFHWLVVIGLGTVWILDGLEVTIVGSVASRLTEKGSGIAISTGQIGTAAACYVAGACLGALFFGQLTDRFGRKKLFIITLGIYLVATGATAFAFAPWYFFVARFFTGAGIGGEYAAINSAIDELIPARVRGRVDLIINGSYWLGSAAGSAAALLFLDTSIFAIDLGWRLAFGLGVVLGIAILLVRRNVPESPRWLFIHGREEEAERIVSSIEDGIREDTGEELPEPEESITVRQRESIPFRTIARTAFKVYPKRAILGLALFVGQAFIYNGVTFNLGTLFTTFFGVSSSIVPIFIVIYALGNFAGPVTLGRLFDTVGRKPMIAGAYLGSAGVTVVMAVLFANGTLGKWGFEALLVVAFFLASAGASAAYLTVSEIFPMETRALAIAFFYAVGTAAGGIAGPLLFGNLIGSGERGQVEIAFLIGAVVMAIGGIAELAFGVRAEQSSLEDVAKPLTAEEAEEGGEDEDEQAEGQANGEAAGEPDEALRLRAEADEERARAAEHRAGVHELRSAAEDALATIADAHAAALDERAAAAQERAGDDPAAGERAQAAEQRANALDERAAAMASEHESDERLHEQLAHAARERARAAEQRARAEAARPEAEAAEDDAGDAARETAAQHEHLASMYGLRARAHELRASDGGAEADELDRRAAEEQELALAPQERTDAARSRGDAHELRDEVSEAQEGRERDEQRSERGARRREQRIRERVERRARLERTGARRFRPGPGTYAGSRGMMIPRTRGDERALDREIEVIARALDEHGATDRRELARLVGARYWGPGRFRSALGVALDEGRARRVSRSSFAPPEHAVGEG